MQYAVCKQKQNLLCFDVILIRRKSPVCLGLVYLAYCIPHFKAPEQSQQPRFAFVANNWKHYTIFICYFITKLTSQTFLCKKLTVQSSNMDHFTKMNGELQTCSDIVGVEKLLKLMRQPAGSLSSQTACHAQRPCCELTLALSRDLWRFIFPIICLNNTTQISIIRLMRTCDYLPFLSYKAPQASVGVTLTSSLAGLS